MGRRSGLLGMTLAVAMWTIPVPALAHGLGGRQDLPVPLGFFVSGAAVVLVLSFAALAVLWPRPRLQEAPRETEVARWLARPMSWVLRAVGLLALVLVVVGGIAGIDNPTRNPAPVLVFVAFWLVVPFVSGLVGDVYPVTEPWSPIARMLGAADDDYTRDGTGYLPAVGVLLAFTWLELVAPDQGPRAVAIAAVVYTAYLLWAFRREGLRGARSSFDGFALYNRLFGGMAPLRWTPEGRLLRRPWLRGLPGVEERRGLVAFVIVMIGTVTYDGASASGWWRDTIHDPLAGLFEGLGSAAADALAGTIGLIATPLVIGIAYLAASTAAARLGGGAWTGGRVAVRFAHSLVPIAFAYAFAHYFTLVLFEGQLLISTVSDPFGQGWDLFGTASREIDYSLIAGSANWVWYVQVAVIVAGHVAGVVLAHDRALEDFPREHAVASQYAMLGLMVLLTGLGLVILAAG